MVSTCLRESLDNYASITTCLTCFKESLDMFEEPGLMPGANLVQLSRLTAVDQVAGHHHRLKDKNQVDLVVISSWS